jgi:hypothetical protein
MSMRPLLLPVLAIVGLCAAGEAAAGQLVVVESTVAGIASGQILDGAKPLDIAAGKSLTVITESGQVKTLTGPFSGLPEGTSAAAGGPDIVASLSRLIEGKSGGGATLGAMRGSKRSDPPGVWDIDAFRSGTHCIVAGREARLWRAKSKKAMTLQIKTLPYGKKVAADWAAGTEVLAWPAAVDVKDGAEYLMRRAKGMTATRVTLRLVPEELPSDAHRVAWMADNGCVRQAKELLAGLY